MRWNNFDSITIIKSFSGNSTFCYKKIYISVWAQDVQNSFILSKHSQYIFVACLMNFRVTGIYWYCVLFPGISFSAEFVTLWMIRALTPLRSFLSPGDLWPLFLRKWRVYCVSKGSVCVILMDVSVSLLILANHSNLKNDRKRLSVVLKISNSKVVDLKIILVTIHHILHPLIRFINRTGNSGAST